MAAFEFRHGQPVMIDYTAGSDIDAGNSVLIGTGLTLGIAHGDIPNGTLGALAAGGGVYRAQVASNYAAGTAVYKDPSNNILTTTSTNNALFGFTLEASPAANTFIDVLHKPYVV